MYPDLANIYQISGKLYIYIYMPIDSIPDYPHIPMAIPHHHFACLNLPESCTFAASWSDNFSRGTLANNQNTVFWCHQTSPKKWGFHLVGTKCAWLKVVAICYIVIYIYICVIMCVDKIYGQTRNAVSTKCCSILPPKTTLQTGEHTA